MLLWRREFRQFSDEELKQVTGGAGIDCSLPENKENNGLKPTDLKKALDAVKQYKDEFIKAWNEYFDED